MKFTKENHYFASQMGVKLPRGKKKSKKMSDIELLSMEEEEAEADDGDDNY